MIETRLFKYFLVIAREQNITRAAERLFVTQSTLSKQMMDLEKQLGKKLFVRGGRQITLTEDGVYFRSRAQEIVDLVEQTEAAFEDDGERLTGDVFLGAAETPAIARVSELIAAFQRQNPGVRFHIFSGDAERVAERMKKGLIDFGLFIEPRQQPEFDYQTLGVSDAFGVLMAKDAPLAQKPFVTPQDLAGLPLLVGERIAAAPHFRAYFGRLYDSLNVTVTFNLIYNVTFLAEQGAGYALSLEGLVNTEGRNLTFRPLRPELRSDVVLVTKKYQVPSPTVKAFLETLTAAYDGQ